MRPSSENPRRRWIASAALGTLLLGALMSVRGPISCAPQAMTPSAPQTRPVTMAEAQRLAAVRVTDYRAGHAGVRATIGSGPAATHLSGWVDWRAPFVYLNVMGGPGGAADGLIQAAPGVVAFRAGRTPYASSAAPTSPYPPPPAQAPPTGWQVRPAQPSTTIDTLITLLFTLRAGTADDAASIQAIGSRFVTTDEIRGVNVDVIDGAAAPPATRVKGSPSPTPSASGQASSANGGQVRYWIDAKSRLLRVAALINATTEAQIDFDLDDHTVPQPIELLGGRTIDPKPATTAQLMLLSRMRLHDHASGGGRITLAIPNTTNEMRNGVGWSIAR